MNTQNYVRLPLKNAYNVRELGGYPCANGKMTKWHSFIRADDLSRLDDEDIRFLLHYGLSSVVDLRDPQEAAVKRNPLAKHPELNYVQIPLAPGGVVETTKIVLENPAKNMPLVYLKTLKSSQKAIYDIFTFMSEQKEGCTLFHCAGGKDRTGLIAMLLLGLAGVSPVDIIANYEVAYTYLLQRYDDDASLVPTGITDKKIPIEMAYSKAEYLRPALVCIGEDYGGFESYLLTAGLAQGQLLRLKKRLTT